ncbi:DUF5667 domain-containing protein [Aeromicrobium endophyticum]|uniref:DUF5667 domain-containing protein n=1 Tax=Aeromicrobium endophyticum TaxID=2292704 RepID=A0A371P9G0_9ACTN|nr:DUF5667 domain-containing protein [Aeromicrobium endophyticum]REK72532.1 hypothetical protein DX116_02625 [Aeromicrobium endophyticum]
MIGRRSHDDAQQLADALDGRTPTDAGVAELVRFAESLCEAATVEPTPMFRESLRAQLMADAATVLVPASPAPRPIATDRAPDRPARRRLATATAVLVASAGAVGLVASSASAVPGEMLYPVKRGVESAELALHRGDASRGAFQLAQASERLAEARALSADGRSPELIAQTLDDFAASTVTGSSKLFDDYSTNGATKSVREVNSFAATSSLSLSELSGELPDGVGDSLAAASAAVTEAATQAATLCASCEPADVGALSSIAPLAKALPAVVPTRDTATRAAPPASSPRITPPATPSSSRSATPAPTPTRVLPSPATTTPPVSPLAPLTDPLLGGLLGDDDQVGLVPGLVNGLLGTTPKP